MRHPPLANHRTVFLISIVIRPYVHDDFLFLCHLMADMRFTVRLRLFLGTSNAVMPALSVSDEWVPGPDEAVGFF